MAANFKSPPILREGLSYEDWTKELAIWKSFTDLSAERQGPAVFLTLTGKAREAVLASVTPTKLASKEGVQELTNTLDKLFLRDEIQNQYAAFDRFISFRREPNVPIRDFLIEYDLRYRKIKSYNMGLPEGVQAYCLLKCANLGASSEQLCRATCSKLTYKNMKEQIEKVTPDKNVGEKNDPSTNLSTTTIQPSFFTDDFPYEDAYEYGDPTVETDEPYPSDQTQDTFFTGAPRANRYSQHQTRPSQLHQTRRQNPPDEFGNPTTCSYCRSILHYLDRCPHAPEAARRGRYRPRGRGGYQQQQNQNQRGSYRPYGKQL